MAKVNLEKFSKEELQKIVSECSDKTQLATKLGFTFCNGKVHKKVVALVERFGISIDHFDSKKKLKARRIYPIIKKNCPVCSKEFETQVGNKEERITCSWSCSNIFFSDIRHTTEANNKTSKSLNTFHELNGTAREVYSKNCVWCKVLFETIKKDQKFCSSRCAAKYRAQNPQYVAGLIAGLRQRIANGTHKGWASRSKLEPSFPEKVVIGILEELSIKLERELKIGKWFIDFADMNRKIAIEIDGRQHNLPERKISDANKDAFLISQGWQVYRIKWKKLTKEFRQEVKDTIEKILTGPGV